MKTSFLTALAIFAIGAARAAADALPSWKDTQSKKAIVAFVEKVTTPGSPDYVDPAARIATFDNDGCLCSEQPMYFRPFYIFGRLKELAPRHLEWKDKEPYAIGSLAMFWVIQRSWDYTFGLLP